MTTLDLHFRTRDGLISHLTNLPFGGRRILAHAVVGDVLWRLATSAVGTKNATPVELLCGSLACWDNAWTEQPFPEGQMPYSCPLSFFDIAGFDDRNWREKVRAYHESMQRSLRPKDAVFFQGFTVPYVTLTSRIDIGFKSILEGEYNGESYVLTPAHLRLATDYRLAS